MKEEEDLKEQDKYKKKFIERFIDFNFFIENDKKKFLSKFSLEYWQNFKAEIENFRTQFGRSPRFLGTDTQLLGEKEYKE